MNPFLGPGEKHRNPRELFARMRVEAIAAHSSLLVGYLDNECFEKWPDLRRVVESARTNASERKMALAWYDDFRTRAESANPDFVNKAKDRRISYFREYVREIRKDLYKHIHIEIKNPKTGYAFTSDDKKTILGECFNPEFYNQEGAIDFANMDFGPIEDRLNEIGVTFGGKSIEDNPVTRFSAIMKGEVSEFNKFKPKKWMRVNGLCK